MSTALIIVLNLVMSFVAVSAVAAGWVIARRLRPASPADAGRVPWHGLVRPLRFYRTLAPTAALTNSSAR